MAKIISIDVSPNPMLKNTSTEITVTFDSPVRGLSATDFTDPHGDIKNVTTGEGVKHVFKFIPDKDYVGTAELRLRGGGWWDTNTALPGLGQSFDIEVAETLPKPRILDFRVDPQNPEPTEEVAVIIDFSESSTLTGAGILANGDEDLAQYGYDVASVDQEQVTPDIYRWTIMITPNDNFAEDRTLEFVLPAENYESNLTGLSGENSANTTLNPPEPPEILSFTATPENPSADEDVTLTMDFSETITFTSDILFNGAPISESGYDPVNLVYDQVDPDTYRITATLSPNDRLVEGEEVVITLPAENYESPVTGLPGKNTGEAILNEEVEQTPTPEDNKMANHLLWHQGRVGQDFPNCGGCKEGSLPSSRRIAAEYHRGMYTLTNVIYPFIDPYNYSNQGAVRDCLDKVKPNDIIYMTLVPPMHRIMDVAVYSYATMEPGSTLTSLAGMEVDVVAAKVTGDGGDEAENMGNASNVIAGVKFPAPTTDTDGNKQDSKQVFSAKAQDIFTAVDEWRAYGIRIKKLPTDTDSLADIKAGLALAVHALGFDAQIQMG